MAPKLHNFACVNMGIEELSDLRSLGGIFILFWLNLDSVRNLGISLKYKHQLNFGPLIPTKHTKTPQFILNQHGSSKSKHILAPKGGIISFWAVFVF